MNKILFAAAAMFIAMPGTAIAGSVVLNTGYNYTTPGLLPIGQQDQTWIKIASYEPPAINNAVVPVAAAWVIPSGAWLTIPGARYLGPRPTQAATPGTNSGRPAYSIFRKCFCLLDVANVQLSIDVRGDDSIHVWLNGITNTLVSPTQGNYFGGPPHSYPSAQHPANPQFFRTGRNCLYVLLEDVSTGSAGALGFTLGGTVSAPGLMAQLAVGPDGNFGPCGCPGETASNFGAAASAAADEERSVVRSLVGFAESRRRQALARAERVRLLAGAGSRRPGAAVAID